MEIIDFDYKRLRVAQDLQKRTIGKLAMKLLRQEKPGKYQLPEDDEVFAYIHQLAKAGRIKHYILKGEHEDVFLFDNDEIDYQLEILEKKEYTDIKVVQIQCYDKKVDSNDNVPIEISNIDELYRIPETTFNSGTCVYFLCHRGKVVYVGQSENIHSRLTEHRTSKIFDDVYYIRVPFNKLNKVESALIGYLKPEYNKTSPSLTNEKIRIAEQVLNNDYLKQLPQQAATSAGRI